jgi:cysteinyl-tRNA synthetase
MKLYNTLTKSIDEFQPIKDVARIYSCGPTVYNHAHIGNLSAYIYADILRRAVGLAGFSTEHVMNFTDVDDKTIRDSAAKYPDLDPMERLLKFTRHYEEIFRREMVEIGNDIDALHFERATKNIAEMQALITKLLEEKIAYIADDGIYFSIREYQKTRKYGQLSKVEIAQETVSRIDNDEYDKESAQDFSLWKFAKPNDPN